MYKNIICSLFFLFLLTNFVQAAQFDIVNLSNITITDPKENITEEPTSYSYSQTLDDIEPVITPNEYFITGIIITLFIILLFFCFWMAFKKHEVNDGEDKQDLE